MGLFYKALYITRGWTHRPTEQRYLSPAQRCRSSAQIRLHPTCVVTRTHSTFSDRAFAAAGPGLWNSLPSHLKEADLSYNRFWWSLKTFFVRIVGHGAVWTTLIAPFRNNVTYWLSLDSAMGQWLRKREIVQQWSARKSAHRAQHIHYSEHYGRCSWSHQQFFISQANVQQDSGLHSSGLHNAEYEIRTQKLL